MHVLGGIVALSFLFRLVAGWLRATPAYFADEYIYAELGRSIAETGRPLIRDCRALPGPPPSILTAPAWLFEDVEVSFRVVQAIGALAMSLAAVPVFFLCRRLALTDGWALAIAFFAVAVPDLLYASWIVAEPVAYPLALGALLAGTAALARPTRGSQVAFVVLAGLATFARIQFIVLPLAFVAALALVGLRERRLRSALREQVLVLGLFGAVLFGGLATGPGRMLGYYHGVLDLRFGVDSLLTWLGSQSLVLAYASGWVLVPGALLGLVLALWRPVSRTELAFAALALFLTLGLLFEGALYAASGGNRVQERYFFYALPLVAIFFVLYARRGWPHRLAHVLLAAGLVTVAARVPLSGFAAAEGRRTRRSYSSRVSSSARSAMSGSRRSSRRRRRARVARRPRRHGPPGRPHARRSRPGDRRLPRGVGRRRRQRPPQHDAGAPNHPPGEPVLDRRLRHRRRRLPPDAARQPRLRHRAALLEPLGRGPSRPPRDDAGGCFPPSSSRSRATARS